jgi:peroxiredoxin
MIPLLLAFALNTGDVIPKFEAKDQHGAVRTFASIQGPKGAYLVFFRSADW